MRRSSGPDLQRAVQFLSTLDRAKDGDAELPVRPNYDFLARYASDLGHDVSPEAVREAFRLIMQARLVAVRRLSGKGGGDR